MNKRTLVAGQKGFTSMPVTIKAIDKENYRLTMVASTQAVDRHGDTILQAGWDLVPYAKNPVILNSHNYGDVCEVIARAENTRIEGKGKRAKLVQDWVFAVKENPKAEIAFNLYAGGFLHASSVGFIPRKFAEKPDGSRDWYIIEEAELLEVSAVSVPANATATLAKSLGVTEAELKEVVFVDEDAETTEPETEPEEEDEETETDEPEDEPETPVVEPEPVIETPEEKRAKLLAERDRVDAELKALEPAAPEVVVTTNTVPTGVRVIKALATIEADRTKALLAAQTAIAKLLGTAPNTLPTDTQAKIKNREYNKVIRNLIKAK